MTIMSNSPANASRCIASVVQDVTTSPSSTTMSDPSASTNFPQIDDLAVRAHASAGFLATRKVTMRSDPALLTCFDAADKELYDLWVPKT